MARKSRKAPAPPPPPPPVPSSGYQHYTLPVMPPQSLPPSSNGTGKVGNDSTTDHHRHHPYYLVLNPGITSSLPRLTTGGNSKFQPLVNPALTDGTIKPIAVSDYDDPLRLHQLSDYNPTVNVRLQQPKKSSIIKKNQSISKSSNHQQQQRAIPSFHLTKNVSSTLSKVTVNPIEFCTLPRAKLLSDKNEMIDHDQIPLTSFLPNQNQQQRLSTVSTISNQSSEIGGVNVVGGGGGGNTSATSSLYYVDYRDHHRQQDDVEKRKSMASSSIDATSTITPTSSSSTITDDIDSCCTSPENGTKLVLNEHFPPPPDALLRDDDDIEDNGGGQSTPTNGGGSTPLPPPPPPPPQSSVDYPIETLQRHRTPADIIPPYSTGAILTSFPSSGTLRSAPPKPPIRPPPAAPNSVASTKSASSLASSSYADPCSISLASSSAGGAGTCSPMSDDKISSTHPSPAPTPVPMIIDPNRSTINNNQKESKKLFNRKSSPTYGWVYHQGVSQPEVTTTNLNDGFDVKRCDSLSLADTGATGIGGNAISSLDSDDPSGRNPLNHHHRFDSNNNTGNGGGGVSTVCYRNRVFDPDHQPPNGVDDDEDERRTKARILDRSYTMFFGDGEKTPTDGLPNAGGLGHQPSFGRSKRRSRTCCCRLCQIIVVCISVILLLLFAAMLGITLYYDLHEHRDKPVEAAFQFVRSQINYILGEDSETNSTSTAIPDTTTPGGGGTSTTTSLMATLYPTVSILFNLTGGTSRTTTTTTEMPPTTPMTIPPVVATNRSTTTTTTSIPSTASTSPALPVVTEPTPVPKQVIFTNATTTSTTTPTPSVTDRPDMVNSSDITTTTISSTSSSPLVITPNTNITTSSTKTPNDDNNDDDEQKKSLPTTATVKNVTPTWPTTTTVMEEKNQTSHDDDDENDVDVMTTTGIPPPMTTNFSVEPIPIEPTTTTEFPIIFNQPLTISSNFLVTLDNDDNNNNKTVNTREQTTTTTTIGSPATTMSDGFLINTALANNKTTDDFSISNRMDSEITTTTTTTKPRSVGITDRLKRLINQRFPAFMRHRTIRSIH